jgi:hypothetical protein
MKIDNGKSIENFNDIPEFYKEIINCWVELEVDKQKHQLILER